jgi:hypothetical protein
MPEPVNDRVRPILLKNSLRVFGGKIVALLKAGNLRDSREQPLVMISALNLSQSAGHRVLLGFSAAFP